MLFDETRYGKRRRRDRQAGVTLIEMMVVLVIIAVVAAMVVPNVIGRPDEARVTVAKTDLRAIAGALELYRLDNRTYPSTGQGLAALVERPTVAPEPVNWATGGYLSAMPKDPWGSDYIYRSPGQDGRFDLISLGADGQPGGDGVNADIEFGTLQAADG
ncbi:type II secretion system major pseudopilin GspG [Aquicoccus porphyridii]|uniref:Type II secretion system core protein G n=1 Tax=Aquicoccus porphyridii TaxID=1852029 RepID=A0A5A9ZGF7_9RHOB|nr:type II secretion system major pseudopilin GspG [Aquicoccus porphyridii]KAA0916347.1 type II secretion system protein GspG [Aquicoccus porphyridii]RAI53529.1 type II secretion system protein GspG [Rhodobacteraceae bacterium AsT-22]